MDTVLFWTCRGPRKNVLLSVDEFLLFDTRLFQVDIVLNFFLYVVTMNNAYEGERRSKHGSPIKGRVTLVVSSESRCSPSTNHSYGRCAPTASPHQHHIFHTSHHLVADLRVLPHLEQLYFLL